MRNMKKLAMGIVVTALMGGCDGDDGLAADYKCGAGQTLKYILLPQVGTPAVVVPYCSGPGQIFPDKRLIGVCAAPYTAEAAREITAGCGIDGRGLVPACEVLRAPQARNQCEADMIEICATCR